MDAGFPCAEWAERARQFAIAQGRLKVCFRWHAGCTRVHLKDRVQMNEVDRAASQLTHGLPLPLRDFLLEAGELSFEYILRIPRGSLRPLFPRDESVVGGADITLASIARSQGMFDSLVDDLVVHYTIGPLGTHLLKNGCPFIAWANSDQLVLDVSQADSPIYYWNHDGESFEVSSSFSSFLTYWETINYLWPNFWHAFTVQRPGSRLGSSDQSATLRAAWETLG